MLLATLQKSLKTQTVYLFVYFKKYVNFALGCATIIFDFVSANDSFSVAYFFRNKYLREKFRVAFTALSIAT